MFQAIEFIAVVTSAVYGILQARKSRMDALGVFTVAFVTAFGGGTLRDILLDRHPLFWISSSHYPPVIFALTLASCFIRKLPESLTRYLHLPDAFGLGLFSVVGTQYAIENDTDYFTAALFGVMTGTFGGVISDVLCAQVPRLFRSAPLYATCSFVGCWVFLLLGEAGAAESWRAGAGIATIVAFRFVAVKFDLRLPEYTDG